MCFHIDETWNMPTHSIKIVYTTKKWTHFDLVRVGFAATSPDQLYGLQLSAVMVSSSFRLHPDDPEAKELCGLDIRTSGTNIANLYLYRRGNPVLVPQNLYLVD